jgi:4-oxalomesaconate hydratase
VNEPLRPEERGPIVVVSAHSADFVWRSGGWMAKAASAGTVVHVICLSYGERGESQALWREEGMTIERAKAVRHEEAVRAARALGAEIEFFDLGDYPLPVDDGVTHRLAERLRALQPAQLLTHSAEDPYNTDHPAAAALALKARMVAQAAGLPSEHPPLGAPTVFRFEPHQPEMCGFVPDVLVDITASYDMKRAAMGEMAAQGHLVPYYEDLAVRRGVQAVRNGGSPDIRYAEAYQRVFPQVSRELW